MPVTKADLDHFRDFALKAIGAGEADSLTECVRRWEERREYEETVAAIREGLEDSAAGRTQPVDEAFADIRSELGLPER